MRLITKLVLAATAVTFAIVIVLSLLFLGELLRQRISQTAASNEVMARQVRMMTRQAVSAGLLAHPPADTSDADIAEVAAQSLAEYPALKDTMDSLVLYSPTVQDVSVTDGAGKTLVSTDPQMIGKPHAVRGSFEQLQHANVLKQAQQVFGPPHLLDVAMPLDLHGKPIVVVHVGVRSTFLENNFVPWLKAAALLALVAGAISMLAAALLAFVALRPIEEISDRLDRLTRASGEGESDPALPAVASWPQRASIGLGLGLAGLTANATGRADAVVRVTDTIDRLGRQMRTTEAGLSDLQTNLNQMLDTLRDGVVLFTAERRAAMVSDAVAHFIGEDLSEDASRLVGRELGEIFAPRTALGRALHDAFEREANVAAETVRLEDGREVEFSLDRIDDARATETRTGEAREARSRGGRMGTLLTLRDKGSARKLEQELEVSRRLAAVGRLTANVGHEVKNPINAMVVHLELLRTKLADAGHGRQFYEPAMRHVDILAGEMERLDRVVQTLADFTRPMELHLEELSLKRVVTQVCELTREQMAEQGVEVECHAEDLRVRGDAELLRQALLNLMLNGMQAMPNGGVLSVKVNRVEEEAVIQIADEGEGIRPELMPRIFELYFTTKAKGSGIGLAMTYRIVQMHGGAMEVASEPGKGAVFTMRLPLILGKSLNSVPAAEWMGDSMMARLGSDPAALSRPGRNE